MRNFFYLRWPLFHIIYQAASPCKKTIELVDEVNDENKELYRKNGQGIIYLPRPFQYTNKYTSLYILWETLYQDYIKYNSRFL